MVQVTTAVPVPTAVTVQTPVVAFADMLTTPVAGDTVQLTGGVAGAPKQSGVSSVTNVFNNVSLMAIPGPVVLLGDVV